MREKRRDPDLPCNHVTEAVAKEYEHVALTQLRVTGYRITMPRVQVIRALADTNRALSAYAIHEKILAANGKIDVVSVYRILNTLEEIGMVHHISSVDGYYPCRMGLPKQHEAAHMVCQECGCVTEIAIPKQAKDVAIDQARKIQFEPGSFKLEIVGICNHCKAA